MDVILQRGPNGEPKTNVPHLITNALDERKIDERSYEWGYMGGAPHELSLNILYNAGLSEQEAKSLDSRFSEEVLSYVPQEGGMIKSVVIEEWISKNRKPVA